MNQSTSTYGKFRRAGYGAKDAFRASRILDRWEEAQADGLVRLSAEPEEERYVDVFGKPDAYSDGNGRRVSAKQALDELYEELERNGCWRTVAEYWDGSEWQIADSCGMHTGYRNVLSPFENAYVVDLMDAALDALEAQCLAPAI